MPSRPSVVEALSGAISCSSRAVMMANDGDRTSRAWIGPVLAAVVTAVAGIIIAVIQLDGSKDSTAADGVPAILVGPTPVDFHAVAEGSAKDVAVLVTSTGSAVLKITGIAVQGSAD